MGVDIAKSRPEINKAIKELQKQAKLQAELKINSSDLKRTKTDLQGVTSAVEKLATESQKLTKLNSIKTYADNNSKAARAMKKEFAQMYSQLNNPNLTVSGLKAVDAEFKSLKLSARDAGLMGKTVGDSFADMGKKFASWITVSGGVMLAIRQVREGFRFVGELDDALTNINYTMNVSTSQLKEIGKQSIEMAKDLNTSATNVLEAVATYANANETAQSILNKARPTIMLSNVTGMNTSETTDLLQGAVEQFDLAADEVLHVSDVFEKVSQGMNYSFSKGIKEISEGIQVSGSVAKDAG